MPVMPSDFLMSAVHYSDSANEMAIRNRVSRAYYSGYLTARDWQIKSGIKIPDAINGGVHARLIKFYEQGLCSDLPSEKQERLAGLLSLSKSLRTKADYKLRICIPASDGDTAIKCAEEICHLLEK
jgi:hypothetical protein